MNTMENRIAPKQIPVMSPSEDYEQVAIFEWAALSESRLPDLKWLFAVPNGGYRDKATGGKLRAQGVKAGVPDMCLPVPRDPYFGLWIELKVGRNVPTKDQLDWIDALNGQGYCAVVCYGAGEAIRVIEAYLTGKSW